MELTHKVYAYITRSRNLLVFRHVGLDEAGILEEGEQPGKAVLREATEEIAMPPKNGGSQR